MRRARRHLLPFPHQKQIAISQIRKATGRDLETIKLNNTLEELENDVWPEPDCESYLVTTCHRLRRKPLDEFTIEDLRIMIGQNIGLQYLVPLAIPRLKQKPLAEGDFFEGDLLLNVTRMDRKFLNAHPHFAQEVVSICKTALQQLHANNIDNNDELHNELVKNFSDFIKEFSDP